MSFLCANILFPVSSLLADTLHFALLSKYTAEKGLITLHSVRSSDFGSKTVRFLPATEGGTDFHQGAKKERKKE